MLTLKICNGTVIVHCVLTNKRSNKACFIHELETISLNQSHIDRGWKSLTDLNP